MKKSIALIIALLGCNGLAAQPLWKHNGIYIVNKSDGVLTITWKQGKEKRKKTIASSERMCGDTMALIPAPVGTQINVSYNDTDEDHDNMPTCRGKKLISFKTNRKIVVYEITGGFREDIGEFNAAGRGIHCFIDIDQRLTPARALKKYPHLQ